MDTMEELKADALQAQRAQEETDEEREIREQEHELECERIIAAEIAEIGEEAWNARQEARVAAARAAVHAAFHGWVNAQIIARRVA